MAPAPEQAEGVTTLFDVAGLAVASAVIAPGDTMSLPGAGQREILVARGAVMIVAEGISRLLTPGQRHELSGDRPVMLANGAADPAEVVVLTLPAVQDCRPLAPALHRWWRMAETGHALTPLLMQRLFRALTAVACLMSVSALPALATPADQGLDLAARLEDFVARINDSAATPQSGRMLIAGLSRDGLLPAAPEAPDAAASQPRYLFPKAPVAGATGAAAQVQKLNMRIALTMLSQAYGGDDTGAVLAARASDSATMAGPSLAPKDGASLDALVLRSGDIGLDGLAQALMQQGLPHGLTGRTLTLQVPLVIWDGATLRLQPGERLDLSRSDGAFVMNFGHLDVRGATIASTGDPRPPALPSCPSSPPPTAARSR